MDWSNSSAPSRVQETVARGKRSADSTDRHSSGPQTRRQRTSAVSEGGHAEEGVAHEAQSKPASPLRVGAARGGDADSDDDSLFDDLTEEESIQLKYRPLLGDPPSVSSSKVVERVRRHAVKDPKTIRQFLESTAKELALAAGCKHVAPLAMWEEGNPHGAETCGQYQAHVLGAIKLERVLARQEKHDGRVGYCLAKRVRNQVYFETAKVLGCSGPDSQITAAPCLKAALQVFAGEKQDGLPREVVRALSLY